MRWLASQSIRRCAEGADRVIASACAAPLPLRVVLATLFSSAATAARLASSSALGRDLPDATDYLAVGLSGLLGGLIPGGAAAVASALVSRLWSAPSVRPDDISTLLFLATCAFVLAVDEAFHHMRMRQRAGAAASEQLASVALAAPGVICAFYLDRKGHVAYRYVSPKAKSVFGLDPDDIRADAGVFFKRLNPGDLDTLNASLFRSARELSLCVVEFLFEHPEKGAIWIEAQAAPVREPGGLVVWHGYASDVTPRKRSELSLAESAARLQATIDAAQDAVLTMDLTGRIQSVNRAGAVMFGYRPDEIVAMNIGEMIALDADAAAEWMTAATAGETREIRGRRMNDGDFPAELALSETTFEGKTLRLAFIKDLSERRRIERQIEELHRSRLDAMSGMASALAHEINQPLTANAAYLRVARRLLEKSPQADAAIVDVLDKAAAQTLRAGRMVTSLKDLARRGEPDKALVGMHGVMKEAFDAVREECESSGIQITMKRQARRDQIVADRTQLKQALANLIRNATEAMQSDGPRELVIATSNPGDNTIRVDVIDSGSRPPESCDGGYYEQFATTRAKSMGVGLSISRSIVEAHHGRIWAAPKADGGAAFSFALPLQDSDADA